MLICVKAKFTRFSVTKSRQRYGKQWCSWATLNEHCLYKAQLPCRSTSRLWTSQQGIASAATQWFYTQPYLFTCHSFVQKQQVTHTSPVCKQSYTQHKTEQHSCRFHTRYQSHGSKASHCLIRATEISTFHNPTYITPVGSHAWQRPQWLAQQ